MLNFAYKKPLSVLFSITLEGILSILDGKFMGKHFTKERSSVVASKRTNEIIYICQMPACEWTQGLLCLTLQSWEGTAEGLKHIRMHSILMKWPQSHSITSQCYPGMDRSSTNTPEPENSNGTPVARSKAPHSHGQAPFFSFLCSESGSRGWGCGPGRCQYCAVCSQQQANLDFFFLCLLAGCTTFSSHTALWKG